MSKAYRVEDARSLYDSEAEESPEIEVQNRLHQLADDGYELQHIIPQYRVYDANGDDTGVVGPFLIFELDT